MSAVSAANAFIRTLWRGLLFVWATATLFSVQALAQVRPTPMGSPDANIDIMAGRAWAGYFIGGFLLLIVLIILRNNQVKKRKDREQARRHKAHMKKMREERLAAQRARPQRTS